MRVAETAYAASRLINRDERLIVMLLLRKLVPARTGVPVRGAAHAL